MNTTPTTVPKPQMAPGRIIKEGHDRPLWEQPNGIVRVVYQDVKGNFKKLPAWSGRRLLLAPITIIDILAVVSVVGAFIWFVPWDYENLRAKAQGALLAYYDSVAKRAKQMRGPHPNESQGLLAKKGHPSKKPRRPY